MSNNKQTSVEWLQWALEHTILTHEQIMQTIGLFEQAKAMHKDEIMNAVNFGDCRGQINAYATSEEYYNETYGGNNEQD